MERKINLPEGGYDVASRGVSVTVDLKALSPDILAECLLHGLTQKVADAASQAKSAANEASDNEEATEAEVQTMTQAMMQKAVDALLDGEWSRRSGGGGVDESTRIARLVTRRLVKAKFGAKSPEWATFTGLEAAEQNAKLDEWFAANEDVLAPERDAEMARRAEAAKAKRDATKAVDFAL